MLPALEVGSMWNLSCLEKPQKSFFSTEWQPAISNYNYYLPLYPMTTMQDVSWANNIKS